MPDKPLIIATRGSALALAQAELIVRLCRSAFPQSQFELRIIKTTGDKLQAESSAEVDLPKGLFTKELEVALLEGEADLAVHSLKDLPTDLPPGLRLGAITTREDPRDVLITRPDLATANGVAGLPPGTVIGTSSPRRQAQILSSNANVRVEPIRGNVPTRLQKLASRNGYDALVLALAGLKRLGYSIAEGSLSGNDVPPRLSAEVLSLEAMLPCVGQGALGIEVRDGDLTMTPVCTILNDERSAPCALAERAFLREMGGGCQTPVAACAELAGPTIRFRALSYASGVAKSHEASDIISRHDELGRVVAQALKS